MPGPSALAAALSVAGIPANRFVFEGFLPVKSGARKKKLQELSRLGKTTIIYESPYRFLKLLDEIKEIFGEVEVTVAREITKKFEEIKKGTIDSVISYYKDNRLKATHGEFVIILNTCVKA
jgi:16S rRNA (cytidine1402-2'-O)-methyltransferase